MLEVGTVGSNKTEDLNTRVFNMITTINEQKTLKKHRSHRCQCKFDGSKCNSDQTNNENVGVNVKIRKNIICTKKIMLGILLHEVENSK